MCLDITFCLQLIAIIGIHYIQPLIRTQTLDPAQNKKPQQENNQVHNIWGNVEETLFKFHVSVTNGCSL